MRRFLVIGFACLLAGCATAKQEPVAPRSSRDLTDIEKTALTRSLASTLKDPDSAHFKWLPVTYVPGTPATDYCGLVNSKNSYGGYVGFHKFRAVLRQDAKGQYTTGDIIDIAQDDLGTDDVGVAWNNGMVDGRCQRFGYVDFDAAK